MYICICVGFMCGCAGSVRPERVSGPLELESQAIVSSLNSDHLQEQFLAFNP